MITEQFNKMINGDGKIEEVQCINCLKIYKGKSQSRCGLCGGTIFRIIRGREVLKK